MRAVPIKKNTGTVFFDLGNPIYYVRDSVTENLGDPLIFPHAEAQARYLSKHNKVRSAEVITIVDGRLRIVAFYRAGKKLLRGRIAEVNSARVFGPG